MSVYIHNHNHKTNPKLNHNNYNNPNANIIFQKKNQITDKLKANKLKRRQTETQYDDLNLCVIQFTVKSFLIKSKVLSVSGGRI